MFLLAIAYLSSHEALPRVYRPLVFAASARRAQAVSWFLSSFFKEGDRRRRGGNVEIALLAISKGRWETWETAVWFSTFSMVPAFPRRFVVFQALFS